LVINISTTLKTHSRFQKGNQRLKANIKVTTVGYATTNDATRNKCYNEQFSSI